MATRAARDHRPTMGRDDDMPTLPLPPMLSRLIAIAMLLAPALLVTPAEARPGRTPQAPDTVPSIVVLAPGSDPLAEARALGVEPRHVYTHVFTGFAADLPAAAIGKARRGSRTVAVAPDGMVRAAGAPDIGAAKGKPKPQVVPTGYERIASPPSPAVDADIAIIDTGVGPSADLNIAGGTSCRGGSWKDSWRHGTHVSGTAAAIDNGIGVLGVAPGARIWAVKVLGSNGSGAWSDVICGLDWVFAHADVIDVANMSLAGPGTAGAGCDSEPLHLAICRVVNDAGIPVVVSAGNDGQNAANFLPGAFPEVIDVSSMVDLDGMPGALDPALCEGERDDTRDSYSNYGPVVDIAAPGGCILSLIPGKKTQTRSWSGTSMAAPHVTGAIALYLAEQNPGATPEQVRAWLLTEASRPQDSPEGFTGGRSNEPMLWLGD